VSERDIVGFAVSFSRAIIVLFTSARVAFFDSLIFIGVMLKIFASHFSHCVHVLLITHLRKRDVEITNTTNIYAFYLE
jgi:hypothetical protein